MHGAEQGPDVLCIADLPACCQRALPASLMHAAGRIFFARRAHLAEQSGYQESLQ
jgi:hypothetical protein